MLARRLILFLVSGADAPFESMGTMKPRIMPSSSFFSKVFAHTMAMSASGLLVIHIFEPFKT